LKKAGGMKEQEAGTKDQLMNELAEARRRVAELESREREWKETEAALRESEARYRLLADNVTDIIWIVDMNLRHTYLSPSAVRQSGYTIEEGMAIGIEQCYTPASLEVLLRAYEEVMEMESRSPKDTVITRTLELEACHKSGSTVWVEMEVTLMRDEDGQPSGFLGITRNIDRRKKAEIELQQAYEREKALRSALEVEIKRESEFLRALVHELKTPLTPVVASSALLASELPEGPMLNLARNIERGATSLDRRIDELLDLARGEMGMLELNRKAVQPLKLLQNVFDDMRPMASADGKTMVLDMPGSLPLVWADEDRLRQVVMNLVNNACKFTPKAGRITLRAHQQGGSVLFEVEDDGPGIDEQEQRRLFVPYSTVGTAGHNRTGLGLGLALCKKLVDLHGGDIWVRSVTGTGSTFGFSIPVATPNQREGV